jgi:predicted CXXCH cytochrome family protein
MEDMRGGNVNLIRGKIFLIILIIFIVTAPGSVVAQISMVMTHSKRGVLPKGCASCHQSHGAPATMLLFQREDICFSCHSAESASEYKGTDIKSLFLKTYRHPVIETSKDHFKGEELPERDPSIPRHVACEDCHEVHSVRSDKKTGDVSGYTRYGTKRGRAGYEYEVCFKCHSDSNNLPAEQENMRIVFDPSNPSYHPVVDYTRNGSVSIRISLKNRKIKCSDCHGNSDPYGPQGPHGSDYEWILKYNYNMNDGPETPFAYELCYQCHRRDSILNDESFKGSPDMRPFGHKGHIVYAQTSCNTCHTPHGSEEYEHLIRFNERVVSPDSSGLIQYINVGGGYARCYLTCHGYEHKEQMLEPPVGGM